MKHAILFATALVAATNVAAQDVERQFVEQQGYHCLDAWFGGHANLIGHVAARLYNPKSFEHVSTDVCPVDNQGNHTVIMMYGFENMIGNPDRGVAVGIVRQNDCQLLSYSIY